MVLLLVETVSLLQAICGFGMLSLFFFKLSLRSEDGIIGLFADKGSCWLGSKDVVKASVDSTEENSI